MKKFQLSLNIEIHKPLVFHNQFCVIWQIFPLNNSKSLNLFNLFTIHFIKVYIIIIMWHLHINKIRNK